jgi:3-hydroxyacyl-[acyl-carrier protein] dehydratase/trans-2-decenoyl-[acyl-carrier protein] isomerase
VVRVEIDVRRYAELPESGSAIAIGDATLLVDGEPIYSVKRAKTGLFRDIAYRGYPNASERARGGRMER